MDISPLTVLLGGIVVAVLGYLGVRYKSQRETSGSTTETPADTLWRVMGGRVKLAEERADRIETANERLESAVHGLRGEIVNYRNEQVDARRESLDKERVGRTEIEALTARVKELEGQLAAALAEVKSLRLELGRPTNT